MSTLSILFLGAHHYAAARDAVGSAVTIRSSGAARDARPNELTLAGAQAWVGTAAICSELAALTRALYVFRCTDLRDFDGIVTGAGEGAVGLSSEGALGLLARKARADAAQVGAKVERFLIALDCELDRLDQRRLESFLGVVLGVPVQLQGIATALEQYLHHRNAKGSQALLAILQDQAWIALGAEGRQKALAVPNHSGLRRVYDDLTESNTPPPNIPAWSAHKVWHEFVTWYADTRSTGDPHCTPFLADVIDSALRRRAVSFNEAQSAIRAVFNPAFSSLFGALAAHPPVDELYLLGDDAVPLGLVEHLSSSGNASHFDVKRRPLASVALSMAQHGAPSAPAGIAAASVGVLTGGTGQGERPFNTLIEAGAALPAKGMLQVRANQNGQVKFNIGIGSRLPGHTAEVIRDLVFESAFPADAGAAIDIHFALDDTGCLRVSAIDGKRNKALGVASSKVPGRADSWLAGPERIASLSFH
ncbi:hypothetical protein [Massilia genomosp. 1]|uniref:Uncharacterized protein n=1 Tax=Massilia genomosp. 1 TaxID=2609280 RepID=A0ABX0MTF7_9BURK|nr:hypothetical protein [Massilia genomosp. 1]NHZ63215.1 hypothetical protein [Massilia genomosp. 1]